MKTIVCYGDSITYGYGVSPSKVWHQIIKKEIQVRIINRGRNGDSLLGMQLRLKEDVIDSEGDICFFMAGSNDLMMGKKVEDVFEEIKKIKMKMEASGKRTFLLCPPPAIPKMAEISWDSFVDYNIYNEKLSMLSKIISKEFYDESYSLYWEFMNLEYSKREKLFLDGIHLNEEGNAYIGKSLLESNIFRTM